jgi:hypothetical protein
MTYIVSMKVILRYLHCYQSLNLYFVEGEENCLFGFSYINFKHDLNNHIFTSVYLFVLKMISIS